MAFRFFVMKSDSLKKNLTKGERMCGRYSLTATEAEIRETFSLSGHFFMSPRYNIAPDAFIPVVRDDGLVFLRWGFLPAWAKADARPFINARQETVFEKPSFKESIGRRRCLIPTNGFYEWKAVGHAKQPYHIAAVDNRLMAFAGIWGTFRDAKGLTVEGCAILTTAATSALQGVHDRMPVFVSPQEYQTWLSPDAKPDAIQAVMAKGACVPLKVTPVSRQVNQPTFDHPSCLNSL